MSCTGHLSEPKSTEDTVTGHQSGIDINTARRNVTANIGVLEQVQEIRRRAESSRRQDGVNSGNTGAVMISGHTSDRVIHGEVDEPLSVQAAGHDHRLSIAPESRNQVRT